MKTIIGFFLPVLYSCLALFSAWFIYIRSQLDFIQNIGNFLNIFLCNNDIHRLVVSF